MATKAEQEHETEATKHTQNMQAVDEAREQARMDVARVEGEEAMRIAKINHPETTWNADPETGAPLVGGLGSAAVISPEPQEPVDEESDAAVEARKQSGQGFKTKADAEKAEAKSKKAMAEAAAVAPRQSAQPSGAPTGSTQTANSGEATAKKVESDLKSKTGNG